jgi:hypothetical protein
MAVARAAAEAHDLPLFRYLGGVSSVTLPVPLMNIINGGAHADNNLDIQEFMIAPAGFARFEDALRAGVEVFHHLKKLLSSRGKATNVGDEGGFAPSLDSSEDALQLVLEAIGKAGYEAGKQIMLALDVAASELYDKAKGTYSFESKPRSAAELADIYAGWVDRYPLVSIEDGLAEDDWDGWKRLTDKLDGKCQIVGDDLFVTPRHRQRHRELDPGQAQPDRQHHGDAGLRADRAARRLHGRDLAPLGRDRGCVHRRPRSRDQRRSDQDRIAVPQRSDREVQPAAAHRRSARRRGPVRGRGRVQAVSTRPQRGFRIRLAMSPK